MNSIMNSRATGLNPKRLLLIDDDPVASEILLLRIAEGCPLVVAASVQQPEATPGFDLYIVDINFGGRKEGIRLAESISATTPSADIFLLSSHLEVDVLKQAMSVNCSGAFDKRHPEDVSALLRAINEAAARELPEMRYVPAAKRSLLADMAALIREWNKRISAEQARGR